MDNTIIELPKELFAPGSSAAYSGTFTLLELLSGPDTYAFAAPLAWSAQVTNTGEAFLLQGRVSATGTTACARCLDPASFDLEGEFTGYYLIEGEAAPDDIEEEEEFFVLPDDHRIDVESLLAPALLLELPRVPLCRDECLGLCPSCGANLNEGDCGCAARTADAIPEDSPFAALKDLKLD